MSPTVLSVQLCLSVFFFRTTLYTYAQSYTPVAPSLTLPARKNRRHGSILRQESVFRATHSSTNHKKLHTWLSKCQASISNCTLDIMQGLCQTCQAPILSLRSSWHRHAQLVTLRSKHSQRCGHALKLSTDKTDRPGHACIRCGAAGSSRPSLDQSPGVLEGIQEQKEQTKWATSTVTQNRHCPACPCRSTVPSWCAQ